MSCTLCSWVCCYCSYSGFRPASFCWLFVASLSSRAHSILAKSQLKILRIVSQFIFSRRGPLTLMHWWHIYRSTSTATGVALYSAKLHYCTALIIRKRRRCQVPGARCQVHLSDLLLQVYFVRQRFRCPSLSKIPRTKHTPPLSFSAARR